MNVAVAELSAICRLIAAWPSAALIDSYELLMAQIRRVPPSAEAEAPTTDENEGVDDLDPPADRARSRDHDVVDLHRTAWRWAQANRLPDGALPSGKAIAGQFARSARWGDGSRRRFLPENWAATAMGPLRP
ncbi:hypothetical protein [Nonomuraea sp. NPDC050310]|uniref:hypothetical protein n=1 Tax=Nonomuraea sp. NPDC050310 TaxID=3154935 RepID=UPI0033D56B50